VGPTTWVVIYRIQTQKVKVAENIDTQPQSLQLRRLQRLTDVIYALVLWRIFTFIPKPGGEGWEGNSLGEFLAANLPVFALIVIGLAFTIIYWLQNNSLFGNLARTDGRHTTLAILQIFLLLLFLYSVRLGIELGGSPGTRLFESITAALVGYVGAAGWIHAKKNRRLLQPGITDQEANDLGDRILAEPLAATFTIPFAFTPILWEVAWLSYPVMVRLLRRRR
jgi:uncharacterized membrane protein